MFIPLAFTTVNSTENEDFVVVPLIDTTEEKDFLSKIKVSYTRKKFGRIKIFLHNKCQLNQN